MKDYKFEFFSTYVNNLIDFVSLLWKFIYIIETAHVHKEREKNVTIFIENIFFQQFICNRLEVENSLKKPPFDDLIFLLRSEECS